MSVLPIRIYGDPVLRQVCAPVVLGEDVRKLAADMIETMYDAPGRGLAAPQVGQALRIFAMDAHWKDSGDRVPLVVINPVMVERSDVLAENDEGCLSIPDIPVRIARPDRIVMQWTDLDGAAQEAEMTGFEAVVAQHEYDHLDGILNIDHLEEAERLALAEQLNDLGAA